MPTTKPSKICCHGRLIAEIIWSLENLGSISGSSIYLHYASGPSMSSNEFTARKVTPLTVTNPADAVEMSVVAVCAKLAKDSAVKCELDDPAELGAAVELDDV